MGRLDGKVAIITGAAQGMGEAHARRFVAEGAQVVMTDVNDERGEPLAAELGEESYLLVCAVNQHSQFYGMKCVIPSMQKAGGGSIINVSSVAGLVSIVGAPNLAYVGSKFASRGMTKHVAVQYGKDNIRVNSVHPGYIKTPMMAAATDEEGGGIASQIPLGRMADPDEVSRLMVWLASDDSSYISGTEQVVDAGLTAQ